MECIRCGTNCDDSANLNGTFFCKKCYRDYIMRIKEEDKNIIDMTPDFENDEMHPERYGGDSLYECKKVCQAWTKENEDGYEGWLKNTILKYLSRFGAKDEKLKEAKKIFNYAKFLLEYEESKNTEFDVEE